MKIVRMMQKYDTEANWIANDPVLYRGEIAVSIDTSPISFKIGDGSSNWSLLDYFGGSVLYTNTAPTPSTIGGIPSGSTFNEVTLQQMWDMLLYPYQYPSFSSFSISEISSIYEVGYEISAGAKTFNWNTTNNTNINSNSIQISGPGFVTETGLINDGIESIIFTSGVQRTTPGSQTWTIQGENTLSGLFSRNLSTNWRWRIYWGISTLSPLNESQIEALDSNALRTNFNGTFSFNASGYKYFCYPSSFGIASSFTDSSTMLAVPFEPYYIVSVTNSYGITTNYNVHRSTNILGGSINIVIS